jgi:hypothetical protein
MRRAAADLGIDPAGHGFHDLAGQVVVAAEAKDGASAG